MALWGARFSHGPADAVFALSRSIQFDWRLAPYDLRSSLAHLQGLADGELLSAADASLIRGALKQLQSEIESGAFAPNDTDEDVHSALERGLTEKLGELGGALRAGRSRNDQVATDLRLYAIDHMLNVAGLVCDLQTTILNKAKEYLDAPAPGFTHLQHAQPVIFGHELAKHAHALGRDVDRIHDWYERTSFSPLGAGALAGSSLPISPEASALNLGFKAPIANSIDAVSDRDFVAEALFAIAMVGLHLSRMGEEWCLWTSTQFGWAKLDDAYATGSSIMPQKKNPDIAELARGKAGRVIGNLTTVLTMLKGLPFAYNRDLQEDKEPLFDSIDTMNLVIPAFSGMIATTVFNRGKMAEAAPTGFSLATEVADFLVRAGVPFGKAHEAAGECVRTCESTGRELHELTDAELLAIHPALTAAVRGVLTVSGALASRTTFGGTAPVQVIAQISTLEAQIAQNATWIANESNRFSGMMGQ
ncbi:MAG: argininosuccinate lyase [Candidatus Nanopelagicaceae bacterium]|nr:argininosuccinate lyase [Candidatus Nanopelagicaceae bacterium]